MQLKCALIFVIAVTSAEIDIPKKPLKSVNDNLLNYNWDPQNRIAPPPESLAHHSPYIISEQRLNEIRGHLLYWYFDKDTFNGSHDLQKNINTLSPQIQKNFNFQLPFFGKKFNYIRISINGYLEFSDPSEYYKYPIVFPVKNWPNENDPSFIGIFFSKCRIGINDLTDSDQRSPGVYFRLESDLMTRTDRFGVEVRERVMWDIREGIIGANNFIPKHVIIVTWKNITFSGGIDAARSTTNTFQVVLATDEISTYTLYNYETINWTTHTEAGSDTVTGIGGVPAFIGFNAGNGTEAYEYLPYSQSSKILDLKIKGLTNNFPGRHIFRIDEKIILGTCKDVDGMSSDLQFVFAAEFSNIFGGTVVNITGPCFDQSKRILCHFDTEDVVGSIIDRHRAFCVQPDLKIEGYIQFEISVGNERFKSSEKYFVRK